MGLDMYLYAEKYISEIRIGKDIQNIKLRYPEALKDFEEEISQRSFKSTEVHHKIGYWRKFNALHHWFIVNCAPEGVDDCGLIYVEWDKVKELNDTVKEVYDDHSKASELLPTSTGFFFGSEEYDKYYFEDLEYTKDLLERILKLEDLGYEIYYQASW